MVLSSPKRKENSRLMNLSGNMNVAFPFNCDRHKSETERKFCSQCKISRKIIDRGKYYYQRTRENRGLLSLGMNECWRLNWAALTKWQGNRWSDLGLIKMHFFSISYAITSNPCFQDVFPFPETWDCSKAEIPIQGMKDRHPDIAKIFVLIICIVAI